MVILHVYGDKKSLIKSMIQRFEIAANLGKSFFSTEKSFVPIVGVLKDIFFMEYRSNFSPI